MQQVITETKAREITGGRKPLVPVKYEEACKALVECQTIDDAKYWDNKADALAAWAKIYKNDEAGLEAKRLKLHAYRRMGLLAGELRPAVNPRGPRGAGPGPRSLLMERGFSQGAAEACRALALKPQQEFDAIVSLPRPPSPATVRAWASGWNEWSARHGWTRLVSIVGSPPEEGVALVDPADAAKIAAKARALIEWLDRFEQLLTARAKQAKP